MEKLDAITVGRDIPLGIGIVSEAERGIAISRFFDLEFDVVRGKGVVTKDMGKGPRIVGTQANTTFSADEELIGCGGAEIVAAIIISPYEGAIVIGLCSTTRRKTIPANSSVILSTRYGGRDTRGYI